jgi:CysZ protein
MFANVRWAFGLIFDPALIGAVMKSLLLTLVLFAVLFWAAEYALHQLPTLGAHWVNVLLELLAPVLLFLMVLFLGAPVAAIFGSLFLDGIAASIEARCYPADPKAAGIPFLASLGAGARFTGIVIVADLVLLPFDIVLPGAAEIATVLVNGLLLGREYFELEAMRHLSRGAAETMRRRHASAIFGGGIVISLFTHVPIVNLFAPLFATALMVHMFKRYAHEDRPV